MTAILWESGTYGIGARGGAAAQRGLIPTIAENLNAETLIGHTFLLAGTSPGSGSLGALLGTLKDILENIIGNIYNDIAVALFLYTLYYIAGFGFRRLRTGRDRY